MTQTKMIRMLWRETKPLNSMLILLSEPAGSVCAYDCLPVNIQLITCSGGAPAKDIYVNI